MTRDSYQTEAKTVSSTGKPKTPTGITGLDEILNGGVPVGGLTVVSGGPGSGKTILGLEFLFRGAMEGRPGIMLTFEEREDALRAYARSFGWDIASLEDSGGLALLGARFNPDAILSGDFDLGSILAILSHKSEQMNARQVVIDAPDVFLRLLDNRTKERAEIYKLNDWLLDNEMSTLMTVKRIPEVGTPSYYDFLDYLADCLIQLDQRVTDQVTTRRMRVLKYRGSAYGRNEYPFGITDRGLRIIPITQASLNHKALGEPVSTGIPGLDEIMGGGFRRCSCSLITGTSGTGKTTFACSFTRSATDHNERVFYLNFEESLEAMVSSMISAGIDLEPALESGHLRFVSSMPESQGIEEHLIQAFKVIEDFEPAFIVVDAISACRRMGSEEAAFDYLLRLIDWCKSRGITSLLTNLTTNTDIAPEITGIDLSSVIDTVIILRHVEVEREFRREMAILKSRGRKHSHKIHEFHISDQGIELDNVKREITHGA